MRASFKSILVANRGEIACRILRTARDLGYRTTAVYSEVDAGAPHVAMADEAVLIGPAPAAQSYLDMSRIIGAARTTGSEAIHPGYGFLSENAEFARACAEDGRVFIGPPAEAVALMGNKAAARRRMTEAGVPCIPGYDGMEQDDEAFRRAAGDIGFPIMVKAAAGGGGRGMRLVDEADDLFAALGQARSESLNAFGSDELILEKAVKRPRHVEFQVMADAHGKVIHLGERDCSIQRRHQKVVEESPCPVMTDALRRRMGQAAVEAARSIDYVGAGTVEFLLDENGEFYFLEMNTRLQVEHPVTEMLTGLDLVAMQIAVARGEKLPLAQDDVVMEGHAIEVRLYAEDPAGGFIPSSGKVDLWRPPSGRGIRVDHGLQTGIEISPFYDAMAAKIIAWGEGRETARRRLLRALEDTALFGPASNRDFLISVLRQEAFENGLATTAFIEEHALTGPGEGTLSPFHHRAGAAVLDYRASAARAHGASVGVSKTLFNWSSAGPLSSFVSFEAGGGTRKLRVQAKGTGYAVSDGDEHCHIEVHFDDGACAEISIDGTSHRAIHCSPCEGVTWMSLDGTSVRHVNRLAGRTAAGETPASGNVRAPMHGQLVELGVEAGGRVQKGQRLFVLEAMKMQHEVQAGVEGLVTAVNAKLGEQVEADALIVEIEPSEN